MTELEAEVERLRCGSDSRVSELETEIKELKTDFAEVMKALKK